jgi:hypothetical protein
MKSFKYIGDAPFIPLRDSREVRKHKGAGIG